MEKGPSLYPYKSREDARRMVERNMYRGFVEYLQKFNLFLDELKGKKVLDVGAGAARFAKGAKEQGIDVVSMDPLYKFPEGKMAMKNNLVGDPVSETEVSVGPNALVGIGEKLPFPDESFDITLNMCSSFTYCNDPKLLRDILEEQLRVLKEGGEIYIYPLLAVHEDGYEDVTFRHKNRDFVMTVERSVSGNAEDLAVEFSELIRRGLEDKVFDIDMVRSKDGEERDFWSIVIRKLKKDRSGTMA